jgi:hypothetical protein
MLQVACESLSMLTGKDREEEFLPPPAEEATRPMLQERAREEDRNPVPVRLRDSMRGAAPACCATRAST